MPQVKVTLTQEEKNEIEADAEKAGTTVSKYLHKILEDRNSRGTDFPDSVEVTPDGLKAFTIRIPAGLYDAISTGAKKAGVSKQTYITRLLMQRGTPVEVVADLPSRQMRSDELNHLIDEIQAISDVAQRSGSIYDSELRIAVSDIKKATDLFVREAAKRDRAFIKELDRINEEISGIRKGNNNGNRKDNPDT